MRFILIVLASLMLSACNSGSLIEPQIKEFSMQQGFPLDTAPKAVWVVIEYVGNWPDTTWNPPIIIRRNSTVGWKNSTELFVNPKTRQGTTGTNYWIGDTITTDIVNPKGVHSFSYTKLTQDTTILIVAN